eukprot:4693319-Pyramimonas_sp.AAC.1
MQAISKSSNIRTSSYAHKWKFAKNEKGDMERAIRLRWAFRGFMDFEAFDVEAFFGNSTAVKPETTRERCSVHEAMDHCLPRHQRGLPEMVDLPGTCCGNW